MASLNKVMLIGRLTANPEEPRTLPTTQNRVIKFRFAVGRSRKNPQTGQWENDPNPLYVDCEAFSRSDAKRDLVGLIQQYCKQGDQLYLDGRLQLDEWTDKTSGQKRSKHKVVVENIEFLGGKGGGDEGGEGGGSRAVGRGGSYGGGGGGGRPAQAPAGGGYSAPDDADEYGGGGGSPPPAGGNGDDIPF